jgi:putative tricarboxylic transport membrane protein
MKLHETLLGLLLLGFAGWVWWLTSFFPAFPGQDYGPNLFPRIMAAGIGLCALIIALRGLRARGPLIEIEAWAREPARLLSVLALPAAVLGYIWLSEPLGFLLTAFLILAPLALLYGARWVVALPTAAALAGLIQWFFGGLMRVPLPRGLLGGVL